MNKPVGAVVRGTGRAVPSEVLDNDFFASYLDTTDEWITSRSGIKQRHRVGEGETTVTLARDASIKAMADAGITAGDLDLIILCTVTPDTFVPAGSCWLQAELGATGVPAMDLNAACAGLAYGMTHAALLISTGAYENILVVGAECLTRITNYQDRGTCVLFGDGAAAVIMTKTDDPERGMLYHALGADGNGANYIVVPAGGSRMPATATSVAENLHTIRMNGREVYKFAVQKFNHLVEQTLADTGLSADDLDLIIPHQSNLRIIKSVQDKLGLPDSKVVANIDRYGNTSSASIGLALDEARRDGRIQQGSVVMLIAFGAGLTWGVVVFRM